MDVKEIKKRLNVLMEDYKNKPLDIFADDCDGHKAVTALNELPTADRTLMMLYADTGSYREVGELLGCSHSSVRTEIIRIKQIIKDRMEVLDELY